MAAGLKSALPEVVSIAPRLEPHLVEVVVWYPFGAADEAVAAAAAEVEERLAQPNLGEALAATPETDEDSPRVATAEMVQAVARLVITQAEKTATALAEQIAQQLAQQIAQAAIDDLITTPGKLRGMLPTAPPSEPGVPWLNNGVLAFTPDT